MKYRPEIDGLRAIAVLAVVLYHAGFNWLSGGYVGVDVFFVISGYLITSIIWRECRADRFSLIDFWERRARRILPAVTVVVLVTLLAGCFLLLPRDFKALGQSTVAQSTMLSNFYFWHMSGYFDQAAELKPLLHTWSLAVEEQFYLIFPLAMYFARKWSTRAVIVSLSSLLTVSLAFSVWQVNNFPDAAFYLLPSRMWELMMGAVLALLPTVKSKGGLRLGFWMSLTGISMIFTAVICYRSSTSFPGIAAILPCLGSALVIAGGSGHSIARGLSIRPLRFTGLVSYSWYLWHWPLFAFMNYWLQEPSGLWRFCAVLVSFVLACVSWKWVEQPFRKKGKIANRKTIFGLSMAAVACMAVVGVTVHFQQGFRQRFSPEVLRYSDACDEKNPDLAKLRQDKWSGKAKVLHDAGKDAPVIFLLGDSFLEAVLHVMRSKGEEYGATCTGVTTPGGMHLDRHNILKKSQKTEVILKSAEWINEHNIKHVIMLYSWGGVNDEAEAEVVQRFFDQMRTKGVTVHLVMGIPSHDMNVPMELAKAELLDKDGSRHFRKTKFEMMAKYDLLLRILDKPTNSHVRAINVMKYFLDENNNTIVERQARPLYYDHGHLTTSGAWRIAPDMDEVFRSVIERAE